MCKNCENFIVSIYYSVENHGYTRNVQIAIEYLILEYLLENQIRRETKLYKLHFTSWARIQKDYLYG